MRFSPFVSVLSAAIFVSYLQGCSQCTAQHDPSEDRAKFMAEQKEGNEPTAKLAEDGTIPPKVTPAPATAASGDPIEEKYATYCVTCHGPNGDASVPAAQAMNPKPRDFTDAAWQGSVDDARIAKVIKEGGAAVGLSPTMAPWGSVLSDADVEGLVKKVRSFKK